MTVVSIAVSIHKPSRSQTGSITFEGSVDILLELADNVGAGLFDVLKILLDNDIALLSLMSVKVFNPEVSLMLLDVVTLKTDDGIATDEEGSVANIELVAVTCWLIVTLVLLISLLVNIVLGDAVPSITEELSEGLTVAMLVVNDSSPSQAASSLGNEVENKLVFTMHSLFTITSSFAMILNDPELN